MINENLIKKLLLLKKNDNIKINWKNFTIIEKDFHKADKKIEYTYDIISYKLDNNFFLDFTKYEEYELSFYQLIEKKHIFWFTSSSTKVEKIENIEIL